MYMPICRRVPSRIEKICRYTPWFHHNVKQSSSSRRYVRVSYSASYVVFHLSDVLDSCVRAKERQDSNVICYRFPSLDNFHDVPRIRVFNGSRSLRSSFLKDQSYDSLRSCHRVCIFSSTFSDCITRMEQHVRRFILILRV